MARFVAFKYKNYTAMIHYALRQIAREFSILEAEGEMVIFLLSPENPVHFEKLRFCKSQYLRIFFWLTRFSQLFVKRVLEFCKIFP